MLSLKNESSFKGIIQSYCDTGNERELIDSMKIYLAVTEAPAKQF